MQSRTQLARQAIARNKQQRAQNPPRPKVPPEKSIMPSWAKDKKGKKRPRLPDTAIYFAVYDAAGQKWDAILKLPPEGCRADELAVTVRKLLNESDGPTYAASFGALFQLLERLDNIYRESLKPVPS